MKTALGGKTIVLKFFVLFIVGDTVGHNNLCGHFQKKTQRVHAGVAILG